MMNKVFAEQLDRILEVYIVDMIAKTLEHEDPVTDVEETFGQLHRYDLRLSPNKCTFGVEAGKYLGFILTNRGVEVNPDKCSVVLNMQSPRTIKEVMQLMGRIASLTRLLLALARRCFPFFKTLRNKKSFELNSECEQTFQELKGVLASPLVLSKPDPRQILYVYMAVADEAVNAALVNKES
jgi:hypothetical protein